MPLWRNITIEFIPKEIQHSEYNWADISIGDQRVGKVRTQIDENTIVIYSINIYPEWAGHGYGKSFVDYCKEHYNKIVADRVRPSAIGFWEKVGFTNGNDGTWRFTKES